MCLKILYKAFNQKIAAGVDDKNVVKFKGPKIVVITPFQSQLDEVIFPQIQELLLKSASLEKRCGSKSRSGNLFTKTPAYSFKFEGGAEIVGMVAGSTDKQDGSGGGSIRGLSANIVVLDEMDMISEETLQAAIKPLLLSDDGVELWVSSTPIGKPGVFRELCNSKNWKEEYYPTSVLPQWEAIKHEIIDSTPERQFRAEYLAEFVDDAYGVFKTSWIAHARSDYTYKEAQYDQFWRRKRIPTNELVKILGIDWNQNAGSEFVVVAFHPRTRQWFVVDAHNVPYEKFSAAAYMSNARRMMLKWKVDWVYADRGYGHYLVEEIQRACYVLKGKLHRNEQEEYLANMDEKIISFSFRENVLLTSPIDGTRFKRDGKQFLVTNAQNIFSTKRIYFPSEDKKLYEQLDHYVTVSSNVSGKPRYGSDSAKIADHRLDALMLALAGCHLETSEYSESNTPIGAPPSVVPMHVLHERFVEDVSTSHDPTVENFIDKVLNNKGLISGHVQTYKIREPHGAGGAATATREPKEGSGKTSEFARGGVRASVVKDTKGLAIIDELYREHLAGQDPLREGHEADLADFTKTIGFGSLRKLGRVGRRLFGSRRF